MRADSWPTLPQPWKSRTINRAVNEVAAWCVRWDIPPVRITREQALADVKGILGHVDVHPGHRSDPGAAFDWDGFLRLVAAQIEVLTGHAPATGGEEDDMTEDERARLKRIEEAVISIQSYVAHIYQGEAGGQAAERNGNAARDKIAPLLLELEERIKHIEGAEMMDADQLVAAMFRFGDITLHATPKGA